MSAAEEKPVAPAVEEVEEGMCIVAHPQPSATL